MDLITILESWFNGQRRQALAQVTEMGWNNFAYAIQFDDDQLCPTEKVDILTMLIRMNEESKFLAKNG